MSVSLSKTVISATWKLAVTFKIARWLSRVSQTTKRFVLSNNKLVIISADKNLVKTLEDFSSHGNEALARVFVVVF